MANHADEVGGGPYLSADEVGVEWLLAPDRPHVLEGLRRAHRRKPTDPCDARALAADLPLLARLLRERHVGVADGVIPSDGVDGLLDDFARRLIDTEPTTWGDALGTSIHRLRWLLRDNHLRARGEDKRMVADADPRAGEPRWADEPDGGPVVSQRTVAGVCCVRVRSFSDDADGERALNAWVADRERHFDHDRIILDLRGNRGGNDMFTYRWAIDYLNTSGRLPVRWSWEIEGRPLILWNAVVNQEAIGGTDSVAEWIRAARPTPGPSTTLRLVEKIYPYDRGSQPWAGRMLVLVDPGTKSSGEGSALLLRDALGARVAGGRSGGCIQFGNVVPYLLPRSGLVIQVGSQYAPDHAQYEMDGISPDVPLDPRTPLDEVAARFDELWDSVGERPST